MRNNSEINQRSIIEDHTVSHNNIVKIQDALKDLDFKDEEESPTTKSEEKNEICQEEEEAYDEEINCDDLDGWDEDLPVQRRNDKLDRLYDFMGI